MFEQRIFRAKEIWYQEYDIYASMKSRDLLYLRREVKFGQFAFWAQKHNNKATSHLSKFLDRIHECILVVLQTIVQTHYVPDLE